MQTESQGLSEDTHIGSWERDSKEKWRRGTIRQQAQGSFIFRDKAWQHTTQAALTSHKSQKHIYAARIMQYAQRQRRWELHVTPFPLHKSRNQKSASSHLFNPVLVPSPPTHKSKTTCAPFQRCAGSLATLKSALSGGHPVQVLRHLQRLYCGCTAGLWRMYL